MNKFQELSFRLGFSSTSQTDFQTAITLQNINNYVQINSLDDVSLIPKLMLNSILSLNVNSRRLPTINSTETPDPKPKAFPFRHLTKKRTGIHPMDVFILLFLNCTPLFRQIIIEQLNKCQLSLPLLINEQNSSNRKTLFLFAFRSLFKSYLYGNNDNLCSFHVLIEKLYTISFIRIGKCTKSIKSKLLNKLVNNVSVKHDCFFTRDSLGGSEQRLCNGAIEIIWYVPRSSTDEWFSDPILFLNLRGDAFEFKEQLELLLSCSTLLIVVITVPEFNNFIELQQLRDLTSKHGGKIILFLIDWDEKQNLGEYLNLPNFSFIENSICYQFDLNEICDKTNQIIRAKLGEKSSDDKYSLLDFQTSAKNMMNDKNKNDSIYIDEDLDKFFPKYIDVINNINESIMKFIQNEYFLEIYFPLQTISWRQYAKEMRILNQDNFTKFAQLFYEKAKSSLKNAIFPFDTTLIKKSIIYILGDVILNPDIESILYIFKLVQIEINKVFVGLLPETLQFPFSIQTFLREFAQLFEINSSDRHDELVYPEFDFKKLPLIFANLLLKGQIFEILDGNEHHIPEQFVINVLKDLAYIVGVDKKIFVLGVLGIQSSGKSTLLNVMFGLHFPVSAGRCSRGVTLQIIPIESSQSGLMGFDYVFVLDSEGLRSASSSENKFAYDNEISTFIVGLCDLTIVNIFGETQSQINSIFQIIILSLTRFGIQSARSKCLFVHHNVSANAKELLKSSYDIFLSHLDEAAKFDVNKVETDIARSDYSKIIDFDFSSNVYTFPNLNECPGSMSIISDQYYKSAVQLKIDIFTKFIYPPFNYLTIKVWSKKLLDIWHSLLQIDFAISFKAMKEHACLMELEKGLFEWKQLFASQIEGIILELTDYIFTHQIKKESESYLKIQEKIVSSSRNCCLKEETKFNDIFFIEHFDNRIFKNWENLTKLEFSAARTKYYTKMSERIESAIILVEKNSRKYLNFEENKRIILKNVLEGQLFQLIVTNNLNDETNVNQIFEDEWLTWISNTTNECEQSVCYSPPSENYSQYIREYLKSEIVLTISQKDWTRINAFLKTYDNIPPFANKFKLVQAHFTSDSILEKNLNKESSENEDKNSHLKQLHFESWLDYVNYLALHKDEDISKTIVKIEEPLIEQLIIEIQNKVDEFIANTGQFSQIYFKNIIEMINREVTSFNDQEFKIQPLFIFEIALFHCYNSISLFKERSKTYWSNLEEGRPLNLLKLELKKMFIDICKEETFSPSFACAKSLATIVFSKMNNYIKEKLTSGFRLNSGFTFHSKSHIQYTIMLELLNVEDNFNNFQEYIQSPNIFIKNWSKNKIETYYNNNINGDNLYQEIQHNYSKFCEQYTSYLLKAVQIDENPSHQEEIGINSNWKGNFHDFINSRHTRDFKLSDLDTILIDPKLINPEEFVSHFTAIFEQKCKNIQIKDIPDLYLDSEIPCTIDNFECEHVCPFCNEPCIQPFNLIEHKHYTRFHHPLAVNGWFYSETQKFVEFDCTYFMSREPKPLIVHADIDFDTANQKCQNWDFKYSTRIIELEYWQLVIHKYKNELQNLHKFLLDNEAIDRWSYLKKIQIVKRLNDKIIDESEPSFDFKKFLKSIYHDDSTYFYYFSKLLF